MAADILLYAVVAAGLVFWLRGILGTRHGDEQERPNPFTSHPAEQSKSTDRPGKNVSGTQPGITNEGGAGFDFGLGRTMSIANEAAEAALVDIARADRQFNLADFMTGAQDAFTMIVEGFAEGDKELLEGLLSPSVYQAFAGAIDAREKEGQTSTVEIHAVRKVEIVEAGLENRIASIAVKFTADETNVLRDSEGNVLSGNPDLVSETIDIWTFTRDIKSRDPSWLLTATRDEDAVDENHKTVPDGGQKAD